MTVILGGGRSGDYRVRILKVDYGSSVVDNVDADLFSYSL